ncbi:MAG: phosphoglycerate dehydrogenase [Oscillospiraceae bacterium]
MNICTLNSIAKVGTSRFAKDFTLTEKMDDAVGVLVRSGVMHDMDLPKSLLAIARAGAGTNNVPCDKCAEEGIVVFNTPGANANGVKELTLAGLIMSSRNVVPATQWVKTLAGEGENVPKLVEKGKGQFVGPEILGKKLGVIGLGAIGVMVANDATNLGMQVYGYDPFISVDAAWNLKRGVKHCLSLAELYENCDYITIHVPCTKDTKGMINKEAIDQMVDGVRILNFARGELVDTQSILDGVASKKVACYVTDFPNEQMLNVENVIAIPHLGASTPESEDNCAIMAVDQLQDYLLNGNIKNSVNMPNADMARSGDSRICIFHKNVPGIISNITGVIAQANLNISNMTDKSRGEMAYTILDVEGTPDNAVIEKLSATQGVGRIRVL